MGHDADMAAGPVIEALGDRVRRRVVAVLARGPKRAGELAAEIGVSAPALSRHLRVLLAAQVIADERLEDDARARVFRLRPQSVAAVRAWLDQIQAGLTESGPAQAASLDSGRADDLALTVWSVNPVTCPGPRPSRRRL